MVDRGVEGGRKKRRERDGGREGGREGERREGVKEREWRGEKGEKGGGGERRGGRGSGREEGKETWAFLLLLWLLLKKVSEWKSGTALMLLVLVQQNFVSE